MGSGQIFLTRVRSDQFFIAQVGWDQPSLVWIWKIFPKNHNFFASGQKGKLNGSKTGQPLIYFVKSMLGSGQGPSLPITFGLQA